MTPEKAKKFLGIAQAVAALSKDISTKVGAVLIGPDGEGGPWGYNGAPRGCKADEDERFSIRDERLFWAEHAERNALYAAARSGVSVKGWSIVVTHFPCMDCARAIVQSGIKTVVSYQPADEFKLRWHEHFSRATQLFNECGINVVMLDNPEKSTLQDQRYSRPEAVPSP